MPSTYDYLYALATTGENHHRWRFHGQQPSFEQFVASLHQDVLCQFVVVANDNGALVGQVVCYAADLRNGIAFIGILMSDEVLGRGAGTEAGLVFINHLFRVFPFRKIYFEMPEYSIGAVAETIAGLFEQEGHLKNHFFSRGEYWDQYIYAVTREKWMTQFDARISERSIVVSAF